MGGFGLMVLWLDICGFSLNILLYIVWFLLLFVIRFWWRMYCGVLDGLVFGLFRIFCAVYVRFLIVDFGCENWILCVFWFGLLVVLHNFVVVFGEIFYLVGWGNVVKRWGAKGIYGNWGCCLWCG